MAVPIRKTYLNNPEAVLDVLVPPQSVDSLEFAAGIKRVTCEIVEGWNGAEDHIAATPLSGGITNALYVVKNTKNDEKVIVRIFGVGTDLFINRRTENEVFSYLSQHNMAPVFHGLFSNGRIEGFLNSRNLIPNEFSHPKIATGVSGTLALLHRQQIHLSHQSSIWSKTKHIIALVEGATYQNPRQERIVEALKINLLSESLSILEDSMTKLSSQLLSTGDETSTDFQRGQAFALQVVFTHNDLLSGNIMIPLDYYEAADNDGLVFIDYEYAGYNSRAFDFANHFCEYAGFDFNMETDFPSEEQRKYFIQNYLRSWSSITGELGTLVDSKSFLDGFEEIVLQFVLLSHLFWGTWAVLQASMSNIDFDFLDYSCKRIAAFHKHKVDFRMKTTETGKE